MDLGSVCRPSEPEIEMGGEGRGFWLGPIAVRNQRTFQALPGVALRGEW
jgi:hypothetical protein